MKTYQIDLRNISLAETYSFEYALGDEFFDSINGPEIRQGDVSVSLTVVRVASAFEFNFQIEGVVTVICDRCLDDMEVSVETKNRLIVTFGEAYTETSDEQVVVSEEDGFIDVAWYMYEFIALAIPIKHVHESGECNEIMTSRLREVCVDEIGEDDDDALTSEEGQRPVDPRWNALRNLMGDN